MALAYALASLRRGRRDSFFDNNCRFRHQFSKKFFQLRNCIINRNAARFSVESRVNVNRIAAKFDPGRKMIQTRHGNRPNS